VYTVIKNGARAPQGHFKFFDIYDPHGCGECGKCREQFSADPHGKDCSYNPVAFPPSMEVRCGECGKCREQFSADPLMSIIRASFSHYCPINNI
jgi:bacterioferritin-associated ferredoxin